ncbi:MAG: GIY-YIG nuclease family protein [Patescibacteria group bacterium]
MNKKLKQQAKAQKDYVLGRALKNFSALAPQEPGVYIFKNKGEYLYIGKAGNLRNRVRQYLRKEIYSPFLEYMLNEAQKIEYKITNSEIEALILESKLIKECQPKFNIRLRDDKQYFYVVFTKEEFPKIFLTHQPFDSLRSLRTSPKTNIIGPFTDGTALKTTLRLLRRIFPYCTCTEKHNNFCLNYHIGKCLGFCCLKQQNPNNAQLAINKQLYQKNIKATKDILSGRRESLIKNLKKELDGLAKKQEFEKAIELRNKVKKLEQVFENAKIINRGINNTNVLIELKKLFKLSGAPKRIEGYDISNIQGQNSVGVMIVFTDGQPDKNEYRKFKIRWKNEPDDTAMLKEILLRRFNHPEWPHPDLIFIDGGKAQLNAAENAIAFTAAFSKELKNKPVISLAKGKQNIFATTLKKPMPVKKLPNEIKNLILNIDAEAHRFAISYYRKVHRKYLLK